ncbi:MAG TPA: hypothetical protein VEC60_19210 [Reyranella sp.]|nr:hypothetical protein [Reyranella sp.]
MGDGGIGFARRDYDALSGGRALMAPSGTGTGSASGFVINPAAPARGGGAAAAEPPGIYSLRGIYFNRQQFGSTADCLTAASAQGLPLEMCR